MERINNFVGKQTRYAKITLLVIIAAFMTACNDTASNPNTSPTPTTTVVVTPTPIPTKTVVVTPTPATPAPTTTVVISPTPIPTKTVVITPTPTPATTVVIKEPITDLTIVSTTTDKQLLLNRRVEVTNIKAQSVIADRAFWVGANNTQQLFVVLAPGLDEGSAENKIVVKAGQALNLSGTIEPMPSPQQAQTEWGLSASEVQSLSSQTFYLKADRIKFL